MTLEASRRTAGLDGPDRQVFEAAEPLMELSIYWLVAISTPTQGPDSEHLTPVA